MFQCLTRARITKYTLTLAQVCYLWCKKFHRNLKRCHKAPDNSKMTNKQRHCRIEWEEYTHTNKLRSSKRKSKMASYKLDNNTQLLKHWKTFKRSTGKEWNDGKRKRERKKERRKCANNKKKKRNKTRKLKDMATTGGGHFLEFNRWNIHF